MPTPPPQRENICAVIVTYHPDPGLVKRIEAIKQQVACAVVVDNHSSPEALEMLKGLNDVAGVTVIFNDDNYGIARALNIGMKKAAMLGFAWVMTFDQDTIPCEDMVENFKAVYAQLDDREKVAVIGVNHVDIHTQDVYVSAPRNPKKIWREVKTNITSGSLMPLSVAAEVGPMREDFFIDSVDHEYCLRARWKGYKIIFVFKPLIKHSMGNRKVVRFPPIPQLKVTTTNYSPLRWYFMTRNRWILVIEYFRRDPVWSVTRAARMIGLWLIMLIFEKDRRLKVMFSWLGFCDGLTGKVSPARREEIFHKFHRVSSGWIER
jgi:rhamnosyltransferase